MSDAWKSTERAYAKLFGGVRQPRTGRATVDVLHPWLAIEVKHSKKAVPDWLNNPLLQVANAEDAGNKFKLVVFHWQGQPFKKGIVCMRVDEFLDLLKYVDADKVKERGIT